ncbi:MAG: beta-ketoacyl synthase N-terminal-like domain-containing protein, partial [Gammaproteobacteria bacterium]
MSKNKTTEAKIISQLSVLEGGALSFSDKDPVTLTQALQFAASSKNGIVIVGDRNDEVSLSYKQLAENATQVLGALQSAGAQHGQAVILQLDELDEFLTAFWACILGKLIPVPVLPFRNADAGDSSFKKLQKITGQLDDPYIIMSNKNSSAIRLAAETGALDADYQLSSCTITTFEEIEKNKCPGDIFESHPDDLAFLQFTSGSTSFPKGVQITHGNVIATIFGMSKALGVKKSSVMLNWMPFYHDMGIIAGHLMAVVKQCKVVAMKPFTFVRRPLIWLKKIDQHRVNITFSPNFGFKRILEKAKIEQIDSLDLSCLDVILNGAEPISVKTCDRFLNFLGQHSGLNKNCLLAGYGLAEASLAVTIAPRNEAFKKHCVNRDTLNCGTPIEFVSADDARASWFVDEGPVVEGIKLRIVDNNDQLLPVDTVGNVQIKGASITQGYFNNDEANQESFVDGWFRTGDLGFAHDNRFVITGRLKDIVFVNGQNYYSHDFEHSCEDIEGLDRLVMIGHRDEEKQEEAIIAFVATDKKYTGAREKTDILRKVQVRINQCFDVTPTLFVLLKSAGEIPKTTSGKVMRHKLLDNYVEGQFNNQCVHLVELLEIAPDLNRDSDSGRHVTIAELKLLIRKWWSEVLGISQKAIGDHDPFFTLGGTSIKAIEVLALAEDAIDCIITHDMFKEYDTIHRLANYIARENIGVQCKLDNLVKLESYRQSPSSDARQSKKPASKHSNERQYDLDAEVRENDIAIIGMGCIFPQADNVGDFWQLLLDGRDCVTEMPNSRCNINQYYDREYGVPNKTVSKWGCFIEDHHFDPKFFNMNEQEAITMDPHQRVFLSAAWQAIEDSGLVGIEGSRMGVFVGASGTGFYQQQEDARMTPSTLTGSLANLAAARVSNAFNLKGPSLSVDTACSSSLVSVDLACKSIINGESDTALAGGVQVLENFVMYLLFSKAGILSPDGKCFTFSDKANGFVPGEGGGAVVLKKYKQAIEDGDRVYAVIKASATNNDGASLGIMSPNPEGQEDVIRDALSQADVSPEDIGYVEAHGTGTNIGDLIEVRSLSLAFNEKKKVPNQSCAIGSVKTNFGHQLAAAGISGLMKAALSVYHQQVPASLNCETERKELKLADTPFFIAHKSVPWPKTSGKRIAAVNSFGFGGTNAHVILSNAYHDEVHHQLPALPDEPYVFCLSAKTPRSLENSRHAFAAFAHQNESRVPARDVAFTYAARRSHYRQNRIAIVARSLEEAAKVAHGDRVEKSEVIENINMSRMRRRIAWLFSGQGSQHPAMAKALFDVEPVFRNIINRCDEIALPLLGVSLRSLLIESTEQGQVNSTELTQPLVFTMDYALAKLWESWGVKPDYMLGHSIGEYVAACFAGVFTLDDALKVVIKRGDLMASLPAGGGMTAVLLPADELNKHIQTLKLPLDIAAYNAPMSTVVSGHLDVLSQLHAHLDKVKTVYQPLEVSHAFHSRHLEPILDEFKNFLGNVEMKDPLIPVVSNVTGQLYQGRETSVEYWADHIRHAVQFQKGIQTLVSSSTEIFLEVGAQAHLTGLTRRIVNTENLLVVSSLPKFTEDMNCRQQITSTQAKLYANGIDIDWNHYYRSHNERRCIDQGGPKGVERRSNKMIGVAGGRMSTVPTYALERRSMFRVVDGNDYPFEKLFKRTGPDSYEYVPDPDSVLFKDHVVARTPMLSGAGQSDLICHLHALSYAHAPKFLRNLSFHQPWLGKSKLSVSFKGNKDEKEFSVTDARGNIIFKGFSNTATFCEILPSVSIASIRDRLMYRYSQKDVYSIFSQCGIEYGDFHRNIEMLHASETEALAKLHPVSTNKDDWTRGYSLHPGILDSAFQATAGLLMAKMTADGSDVFPTMVPIAIDSICIYKFIQDGEYYSHVTLDDSVEDPSSDLINCNVTIYDAEGVACALVSRLQLKRIPMAEKSIIIPTTSSVHTLNEADHHAETAEFFQVSWKDSPLVPAANASAVRWLVLGSSDQAETQLGSALTDYGIDLLLVPYTHYKDADESAFQAIFEKSGQIDGILFMRDFDGTEVQSESADNDTMFSLFQMLKAISKHSRKDKSYKKIRLLRATRGTYTLDDNDLSSDIHKSLSTGFLRTARIEFPQMDICQLDLSNTDPANISASIGQEILTNSDENGGPETLYRDGKRYSLAVAPVVVNRNYDKEKTFNAEKVFWIIGGTSGVGQVLARYLATNFKSRLVLSGSRRLPEPLKYDQYLAENDDSIASTIRFIREIEAIGSEVLYVSTDVRSADSIRISLGTITQRYKQVNGIYFSALQLDDKMILQKEWAGYRNMMDMRVTGVEELIQQSAAVKPEFMILFSSLAGVTGNIGQSDYAASNVYMDAVPFAEHPDTDCRFISVQWGPWSLGQQVSDIVLDHMNRNGFLHISELLGMEALEKIILSGRKNVAFVPGSEGAQTIAENINSLRQGLTSKPKRKTVAKPEQVEVKQMSTIAKADVVIGDSQMQLLMSEFDKQREMLMKLCENQNALLAGTFTGSTLSLPVSTPLPVVASVVASA